MRILVLFCLISSGCCSSSAASDTRTIWDVSVQHFKEFRNRPPFSASRRETQDQEPAVAIEAADPTLNEEANPKIAVSGVVIADSSTKGLLVNEVGSDNASFIREGNNFLGWTLIRIDPNSATFMKGMSQFHVRTPKGARDNN
jgi:hypothetical protein